MKRLPADCLRTILFFLGLRDVCAVEAVSLTLRQMVHSTAFSEDYLLMHFISPSITRPMHLRIQAASSMLKQFARCLSLRKSTLLLHNATAVSSVDRASEGPQCVLTNSRCCTPLISSLATNGQFRQMLCGCAGNTPCYWSSAPSTRADVTEFLAFTLRAQVSLLIGFYVIPYKAYFHPGDPVYGAAEIAIQILLPTASPVPPINESSLPNYFRHPPIDLAADVYFQSPFYPMENVQQAHFFYLPRMVLCFGQVRVLLKGMQQKQPGTQLMLATDDYYMCMSRIDVLGIPASNHAVRIAGIESVQIVQDEPSQADVEVSTALPYPFPEQLLQHVP